MQKFIGNPDVNTFRENFENSPRIRKLFFGREDSESDSIFEKLLIKTDWIENCSSDNDDSDLLKTIWNTFELWDKPEILIMVNIYNIEFFDYYFKNNFCTFTENP